jgi:hypothetical protein
MAEVTLKRRHGNRHMMFLVERYKETHPDDGAAVHPERVAEWAIDEGLWKRPPMDPREVLRRQIRSALREEYIVDDQGREVRANHPFMEEVSTPDGPKLRSTWYPIFDMPPQKMRAAFQMRRRAALADVVQLKLDFESYNDNNHFRAVLDPPDFNFNKDIEEMNMPTEWPTEAMEDEEDEPEI